MDINKLNDVCTSFKNAILRSNKNNLSIALQDFPEGSCGYCNELISYHLKRINFPGIPSICFVTGYKNHIYSHGWLEIDNIIIDLTISQFHSHFKKNVFINNRLRIPAYPDTHSG